MKPGRPRFCVGFEKRRWAEQDRRWLVCCGKGQKPHGPVDFGERGARQRVFLFETTNAGISACA